MLLGDENEHADTSYVTYTILVFCTLLTIVFWTLGAQGQDQFIGMFAFNVPDGKFQDLSLLKLCFTAVFSTFVHLDPIHLIGNGFFLLIFGDNIEYVMGRLRYFLFFLLCGFLSSWLEFIINPVLDIPQIGMSGAVAGILGVYARVFPTKEIKIFFFSLWLSLSSGEFNFIYRIKAFWYLIGWFVLNVFYAWLVYGQAAGGVAFVSHASGFLFGYVAGYKFRDETISIIERQNVIAVNYRKNHFDYMNPRKTEDNKVNKKDDPYLF